MKEVSFANKFESQGILATILKFSLPSSVGAIVGLLCVLTDRYFIGQVAGRGGMSAVAIVFPYAMLMNSVAFLFAGIAIIVGIKIGEKKIKEAEAVLGTGFMWILVIGTALSIFLYIFNLPVLKILGATEANIQYAIDYTKYIIPIAVFQIILGQSTVIRGAGSPLTAMGVNIFTALFNIVLDYIFIMHLGMGIIGASLATFIATSLSALYVVYYFLSNKTLRLKKENLNLNFERFKEIAKIGSPRLCNQLLQSLLVMITNREAGFYGGEIATAAIGIISIVRNVINTSFMGFNQGTAAVISYYYGAKKFRKLKEVVTVQLKVVVTISSLLVLSMFLFTDFYSSFFVKNDFELIEFTSKAMRLNLALLTFTSIFLSCNNFFQAIKDSTTASRFFISRIIILNIPLIYIFSYFFGEIGVWLAFPVSDLVSALIIFNKTKKTLNLLIKEE